MKKVVSDVIQFRGSHYDFGVKQGELLKNSTFMKNRKAMYERMLKKFAVNIEVVQRLLNEVAPGLIEEIQGLSDTLELTTEQGYLHFAGYYAAYQKSGCSIISGQHYIVRNYDNDPFSYDGRFVLYEPTDTGYATMGPTMQVTGRMDGMNEKGLVMGYNFVNTRNRMDGFVCNMIGRIVLEYCATVDEAVELLTAIPHKHSFNYVLLDPSHEAVAVEASPREVVVRSGAVCTNHFQILKDENRYRMEDSLAREHVISSAQQHTLPYIEAFKLMNGTEQGVFAKKYSAWDGTIHTAGYLPQELKVHFAIGGDKLPVVLDFYAWLQGTNLPLTKMKGQLDAKVGFVNELIL